MADGRASEYRRLARECLGLIPTIGAAQARSLLIEMARVWTRLADEQKLPSMPTELSKPVIQQQQQQQQQQQVQPNKEAAESAVNYDKRRNIT